MWNLELGRRASTTPSLADGEILLAEDVTPEARRIVIATPLVLGGSCRPGHSVEIEVAPRTWRRYLLGSIDEAGRVEIYATLTDDRLGAFWASCAGCGDRVRLRDVRDEGLLDVHALRHVV